MTIKGIAEVRAELRKISDHAATAAKVAAEHWGTKKWRAMPLIISHFKVGNVAKNGWQPLAASTLASRISLGAFNASRKQAGAGTIKGEAPAKKGAPRTTPALVKSGALMNAVETTGRVVQTGPESATLTFDIPESHGKTPFAYGIAHRDGTGKIPRRDWTRPNAEEVKLLSEILANRLETMRAR